MIATTRFRLVPGADEAAFREADRRVQSDVAYRQTGLLRRTLARGDDGSWIVVVLWRSSADADAADDEWHRHSASKALLSFVDADSFRTERYTELD